MKVDRVVTASSHKDIPYQSNSWLPFVDGLEAGEASSLVLLVVSLVVLLLLLVQEVVLLILAQGLPLELVHHK
jgi:hypothetical protein